MARIERVREDLIRDAKNLVQRIELSVPGEPEAVIVGFRKTGCVSFYFGPSPVYQFNTHGMLRRAHRGDRLWKAEAGRLVGLTRQRTGTEVQLVRHELTAEETAAFIEQMTARLSRLRVATEAYAVSIERQIPAEDDILGRVRAWLDARTRFAIAESPHAR